MLRCIHRAAVRAPSSTMAAAIPAIRLQANTASLRRTPTGIVFPHHLAPVWVRTPVRCMASGPGHHHRGDTQTRTRTRPDEQRVTRPDQLTNYPPSESRTSTPTNVAGATSQDGPSAASTVLSNVGLSNFLGRVYRTTGVSVAASLALSYGIALAAPAAMGPIALGGMVVSFGSVLGLMFGKRPVTQRSAEDPSQLITVNSQGRQALFGAFVAGNGAALAPIVLGATAISPLIVPAAVAATSLTMFGASYYAYKKPSGSLLRFAAPLSGALLGFIGLQLASVGALYFLGPNAFTSAMWTVYPYAGIGIFSALTAVDTHFAIAEYEQGTADHLHHAVSFYLNAINLLLDFIRIFSRAND